MITRVAVVLATLLLVASCATPQPSLYAPLSENGGYAVETLGKGVYRVTFQGNPATSREQVQDYCLYRAAELTLSLGDTRFAVHDKQTNKTTRVTREIHEGWGGPYFYDRDYPFYRPYPGPTYQRERTSYRAILTIEPFSGETAPGASSSSGFQVYDAQATVAQLAPHIKRPMPEPG